MPLPKQQYIGILGTPLVGGKVYTYAAGTTNPKPTYTDAAGTVPHQNPIVLNTRGEPPTAIFWSGNYRVDVRDALGNLVYSVDNYNTDPAGLGTILTRLASLVGAALIGYSNGGNPVTVEHALDVLYFGIHNVLDLKFAGGADATGATDSTPAWQACADYTATHGGKMFIPYGSYAIDMVQLKDFVYNATLEIDGALIFPNATQARAGVFDIVNCVDFNFLGSCHIIGNDNANYDMAVCVRAQTGTAQATSRVNIYNVTARNLKIGFGIGRFDIDYQCSEINFYGCSTFKCPGAVYCAGSQSGASFINCNLVSENNAAFPGIPNRVLWMEGGFISILGGEVVKAENMEGPAILLNPSSSATYGNPYGILRITGTHIETQSQLIAVVNSRGLAAPDSRSANIALLNCGGYVSGNSAAQDFIYIGDASYVGALSVKLCNFYSDTPRTGYNISSASAGARISCDEQSFGRNFKHWFGGVYGGIFAHPMMPIVSASGIGGAVAAGEQLCKFTNIRTTDQFARHGIWYGDGAWRVLNGIKSIHIEVNLVGGNGAVGAGDFYVKKNGVIAAFGRYMNGFAHLSATLRDLVDGDVITTYIAGTTANTFDGAAYQQIEISGSTSA